MKPKGEKKYKIIKCWNRRLPIVMEGTLQELISYCSYTLEVGKSWEHEKGNKKINLNPKSIESLIKNLENAVRNSSLNGCCESNYSYENVITKK